MAFGAYPLVSLADARNKRDEAYSVLCEGRDPNVAKKLRIEENIEAGRQTFERVAREWHENAKAQWAKIHAANIIRSLERSEEHTSELQSLMRISYAVFCLK